MATLAYSADQARARPAVEALRRVGRHWPRVALVAVCLFTLGMGLWQAADDSITIDEPVYVSAGLTALVRHDLRYNQQHPPLSKVLAAAPALAVHPALPGGRLWQHHHNRPYARAFLNDLRRDGKLHEVTFLSRLVPLLELVATVLLVYALARRLAGPAGGAFAAALWALNPYVLGIGHFVAIDMAFTLAALATVLALVRWIEQRTLARAVVLGLACAAAVLTRDTGPLLFATALVTVAVTARRPRPVLAVAGAAFVAIWLVYLGLDPAYTVHHPNVVPQRFVDGFAALTKAHNGEEPAFVAGRHYTGGRWWFWPASMAIKLPVTLLAAFGLSLFFWRKVPPEPRKRVYLAVLPSTLVLTAFTIATPVNLGLRYMLPVIALLTVCVAPVVRTRARWLLPVALVAGSLAFTLDSVPHSLAWTAPPFRPGYRYATDGNLDWGQDAGRLQSWARGKHAWIACYQPKGGGCAQDAPGARKLPKYSDPRKVHGWVAVSATLRSLNGWEPWLLGRKPDGTIDGTILLYHLPPASSSGMRGIGPVRSKDPHRG